MFIVLPISIVIVLVQLVLSFIQYVKCGNGKITMMTIFNIVFSLSKNPQCNYTKCQMKISKLFVIVKLLK